MSINAREILIKRLSEDIMGPYLDDEVLPKYFSPQDQYLTGVLYPQQTEVPNDESADNKEEGMSEEGGGTTSDDNVLTKKSWLPSSMGISFNLEKNKDATSECYLKIEASKYILTDESEIKNIERRCKYAFRNSDEKIIDSGNDENSKSDELNNETSEKKENEEKESSLYWVRNSITAKSILVRIISGIPEYSTDLSEHGFKNLRLYVKACERSDYHSATVSIVNDNVTNENKDFQERNENCYFQTRITVIQKNNKTFLRKSSGHINSDYEEKLNNLLYRNQSNYATGHTCSASWNENGSVIYTEWLPQQFVEDVDPEGDPLINLKLSDEGNKSYSAKAMSTFNKEDLLVLLSTIPNAYSEWLGILSENAALKLDEQEKSVAMKQIEEGKYVCTRIRSGIKLINNNEKVFKAFQLANQAMNKQAIWQEFDLNWRPFQIGFVLLVLESLVIREKDRNIMDLLWFPTGGGKTEAYLLLIAFILFYRRLEKGGLDKNDGVCVISRYTLRALTTDQFQRTTALICSCEAVRREHHAVNTEHMFSIGLWIGESSTPNKFNDAKEAIELAKQPSPCVIDTCPCCSENLKWDVDENNQRITVICENKSCELGVITPSLPIHTVDEQIYSERPSVIIATVDKYVQICRFPTKTDNLFNISSTDFPPDLILQDELHLISGPLGSMTGLLELGLDFLCFDKGFKPKIIGSTATIQRASEQILALFDRDVKQFPPPIIDADNSFFSKKKSDSTGRVYLGITTAGRTPTHMLQAIAGSLLQSIKDKTSITKEIEFDPYTTLCAYFNSLRILGGARTLFWEDAQKSKHVFALRRNEKERSVHDLQELTSNISQEELKQTLSRLKKSVSYPDHIDMLLASVMLSVGVNIPRLGMMIVDGQPKTIAEYIQATSRVGRNEIPGLIITLYNNSKARDKSHYETFRSWHAAFYRHVEATSVTPFSPRARDKALKALIICIALRKTDLSEKDMTLTLERKEIIENEVIPMIMNRVEHVDIDEAEDTEKEIHVFLNEWESRGKIKYLWNDFRPKESLFISAEKAAQGIAGGGRTLTGWTAPNSARDVEPEVALKVLGRLTMGAKNG